MQHCLLTCRPSWTTPWLDTSLSLLMRLSACKLLPELLLISLRRPSFSVIPTDHLWRSKTRPSSRTPTNPPKTKKRHLLRSFRRSSAMESVASGSVPLRTKSRQSLKRAMRTLVLKIVSTKLQTRLSQVPPRPRRKPVTMTRRRRKKKRKRHLLRRRPKKKRLSPKPRRSPLRKRPRLRRKRSPRPTSKPRSLQELAQDTFSDLVQKVWATTWMSTQTASPHSVLAMLSASASNALQARKKKTLVPRCSCPRRPRSCMVSCNTALRRSKPTLLSFAAVAANPSKQDKQLVVLCDQEVPNFRSLEQSDTTLLRAFHAFHATYFRTRPTAYGNGVVLRHCLS
mmetsp:Transcript_17248/g.33862  ORF Transcript_17248/g.33862 Transcript_17248/m.33862 type:complete len:340 (-) Transcript_17248:121-1140(-)